MDVQNLRYFYEDESVIAATVNGAEFKGKIIDRTTLKLDPYVAEIILSGGGESEIQPYAPPVVSKDQWRERLWTEANRIALQFDRNSRERALAWLMDPECPEWRKERIQANIAWSDTIWASYYIAVEAYVDSIGDIEPLPYTFHQLINE